MTDVNEAFGPVRAQRAKPNSDIVNLRLKESGREWMQAVTERHSVSRSEVLRAALAYAAANQSDFDQLLKERNAK